MQGLGCKGLRFRVQGLGFRIPRGVCRTRISQSLLGEESQRLDSNVVVKRVELLRRSCIAFFGVLCGVDGAYKPLRAVGLYGFMYTSF